MPTAVRAPSLPPADDMAAHSESAASLLRAMANPHRLRILCVLGEGELSVGALNERIPLSQSALSQHLAVLRDDGLVATRRAGTTIHYRIADPRVARIMATLQDIFCPTIG